MAEDPEERAGGRTIGVFAGEGELRAALGRARAAGLAVQDVYSPYAIHGIEEAMGLSRSRLAWATFAGGAFGLAAAVFLEVWCAVVDWPLDVGGKPANSALAFLPIAFELTILSAGLATAAAFLWRSRLHPAKRARSPVAGVTDDRFALVLATASAAARELLAAAGALEVREEVPG